ncbi:MAG: glycosyltransferase family 2 protein, partial [Gemmatimonadales bacterium]
SIAAAVASAPGSSSGGAYAVRRRNVYLGRRIRFGGWGSDWVVRVFPRDQRFVERRVHEHLERQDHVGRLTGDLEHVPYRDLAHHLAKLDRYAAWAARDLADRGRRARLVDLLLRPPGRFFRMYVVQLGLLDGWHGAVLSAMAAASVFLKYARLWELQQPTDG